MDALFVSNIAPNDSLIFWRILASNTRYKHCKMTRFFSFFIAILFSQSLFSQSEPLMRSEGASLQTAQDFIDDLANHDLALDVILSNWVVVENPSDELYDYLEVSLEEIRLNLSTKDIMSLEFKNYRDLPVREVRDIDPEGLATDQMFFIYHKGRLVTSLYLIDKKIGSFTLVSKGNNLAHFVTY